jgi:pilus assembly protein Flp/PilA
MYVVPRWHRFVANQWERCCDRCNQRVNTQMLKFYVQAREAGRRLRSDDRGVVSFEYVIVAACIVAAVVAAFGTGAGGAISTALSNAITAIVAQIPGAAG